MSGLGRRLFCWLFLTEASTRSSALICILLACVVWAAFGRHMFLYLDLTPVGLLRSTLYNLAATMMLFGLFSRTSTLITGLSCLSFVHYDGLLMGFEPWTHHNTRLLSTAVMLCAFLPSGHSYSVDRFRAVRRAQARGQPAPAEQGNVWALRLIALQMSAIYFYGALNKTNLGFLGGARMEHYAMWFFFGSRYPSWPGFHELMVAAAWLTVLFEYALAFGLFARLARRFLVLPALAMHGVFYWWLNVSVFTATVWTLYLAYYDPDDVHEVIDRLSDPPRARASKVMLE